MGLHQDFDLIVVMPVYNEQDCIELVVEDWTNVLKQMSLSYKIILFNDGSTDKTKQVLKKISSKIQNIEVVHKPNEGHGITLYKAYKAAIDLSPQYIFHVDSDDQFYAEDFLTIWQKRDHTLMVLGERMERDDPLHRLVITRILRLIIITVFQISIKDSNCPYRLIKTESLKEALRKIPPFSFAPNIFLAIFFRKKKKSLLTIPVRHKARTTGSASIVKLSLLKACLLVFKQTLIFRVIL